MEKFTTWTYYFNNKEEIEEKHNEMNVLKICTYDVSELNELAQFLAVGASISQTLIKERLKLLEINNVNFKSNEPPLTGMTTEGCVRNLLADLVCY